MYYLEVACGENARAALDYSRHYRSSRLIGLDLDYRVSRAYRAQGWPTFVIIGADGVIRFHGFDTDAKLSGLRRCLEELTPAATSPAPALQDGAALPAEALAARLARRDRSPRLAFDKAGRPNLLYYSNREGTNAVFWRRCGDRGETMDEQRLHSAHAEGYAVDGVFDTNGTLWITWCGRQTGCYDIFVQMRAEGAKPVTRQLTASSEDAMSPKIACGPGGVVAVTYYKWASLRGVSRDRNIYARTYDPMGKTWSEELEINPPVPQVDDHTDPDVVLDAQGRPWVVWSYDYHPQLYRNPLAAEQPTIFAACVASNKVSSPILVGATGKLRDAVDLFPSAAVDSRGILWCAWDCSEPSRCINLARLDMAENQFVLVSTFGGKATCSTPELAPAASGRLLLAWSERSGGGFWRGRVSLLEAGRQVAEATMTESADVLFPQAQQAPDGRFWVTYEKCDAKGSAVVLRELTGELARPR